MSFENMNHYCQPVAYVPPRLCNFCFSNGTGLDYAMSHNEYDYETNQILCPNLINIYCKYCKQHGHTIKHCEILLCKKKFKNMKKAHNYKNKKLNNKKQKKYKPQTPPNSPPRTPPNSPPNSPPRTPPRTPPKISPKKKETEYEIIVINGIEQFDPPPAPRKIIELKRKIRKMKKKEKLYLESTLGESKGPMRLEELL